MSESKQLDESPKPIVFMSDSDDRKRESAFVQYGDAALQESSGSSLEVSSLERDVELRIAELERSNAALMVALESGQLDVQHPAMSDSFKNAMVDMSHSLEVSRNLLAQLRGGGSAELESREPDKLSQFVQFSEEIQRRTAEQIEVFRKHEDDFLNGELTLEEYERISVDREEFSGAIQHDIQQQAQGIDPKDPEFDGVHSYLVKNLALSGTPPEQRTLIFAGKIELGVAKYVKSCEELRRQLQQATDQGKPTEKLKADLQAALDAKRVVYERVRDGIARKRGFSHDEVIDLDRRVRDILRPAESVEAEEGEDTMPFFIPKETTAATPAPSAEEELPVLEQVVDLDEYEKKFRSILKNVKDLETITDGFERDGRLNDERVRTELLDQLRVYSASLLEIGETSEDLKYADDHQVLVKMMKRLRDRLMQAPPAEKAKIDPNQTIPFGRKVVERDVAARGVSVVEDVRAMHARVKASYASVQHRLSEDQRRSIRAHIAQLTSLVRRTELEAAISHAIEHAPALAHVSLASVSTRPVDVASGAQSSSRGIWGVLGDAFRLK